MISRVIAGRSTSIVLAALLACLPSPLGSETQTPAAHRISQMPLPHYIVRSYWVRNADGISVDQHDQWILSEFAQDLRSLMGEDANRVVYSPQEAPPKCGRAFPCEFIDLNQGNPDEGEKILELIPSVSQSPPLGTLVHGELSHATVPSGPIGSRRKFLLKLAAQNVVAHDKLHRELH